VTVRNWQNPEVFFPKEIIELLKNPCGGFPLFEITSSACGLAAALWSREIVLYNFTDHGPEHSRRIIKSINILNTFLPQEKRLSKAEWFGLCIAAMLHDVGMQWSYILREFAPNLYDASTSETWEMVRRAHVDRSAKLLEAIVRQDSQLSKIWPGLAYFQAPESPSWDILLGRILTIIKAHSRDQDGQESGWRDAVRWKDVLPADEEGISALGCFRMPLIASLFRLADELDVTHHRVPNLRRLLDQQPNIPWRSLTFWASCYFVDQVRIHQSRFRLCIDQTKLPASNKRLREVGEFLVYNLIHDKLRRAFLKGITTDTPSIQSVLLGYGLPLLIMEPEDSGGKMSHSADSVSTSFLEIVMNKLAVKPFTGTVPINSYAIRGCDEDPASATSREVRRIRLIDETSAIRVPEALRDSFLQTQTLQASRVLTFLEKSTGLNGEVLTFSEHGKRRYPAISAVLAAAAHIDQPQVVIKSSNIAHNVERVEDFFVLDFGPPKKPRQQRNQNPNVVFDESLTPWRKIIVSYSSTACAVLHMVNLHGLHCIIWPPDNVLNPGLRNFFNITSSFPPGREAWLHHARLLEDIAHMIMTTLGTNTVTLSVLDENPPHSVLSYSTDTDSCITFSGGAMAAAGCFALHYKQPELPVEHKSRETSIRLTVWYEPSQQFRISRNANGSVKLWCQVKRLLEGRLFL